MSAAYKCDGCGALFEHTPTLAIGDVMLTPREGAPRSVEILDFCRECAPGVMNALSLPPEDWRP